MFRHTPDLEKQSPKERYTWRTALGMQNPHVLARASTKFPLCELAPLQVFWTG